MLKRVSNRCSLWDLKMTHIRLQDNDEQKHDPDLRAQHQESLATIPVAKLWEETLEIPFTVFSKLNSKGFVTAKFPLPVDNLRRLQGFGSIKWVLHIAKLLPLSFFGRVEICFRCFPIKIDFKLHRVLQSFLIYEKEMSFIHYIYAKQRVSI